MISKLKAFLFSDDDTAPRDEGQALGLATAVWGSAYLVIGTAFEERKLRRLYGQAYEDYRARVPAFVPWKGRVG